VEVGWVFDGFCVSLLVQHGATRALGVAKVSKQGLMFWVSDFHVGNKNIGNHHHHHHHNNSHYFHGPPHPITHASQIGLQKATWVCLKIGYIPNEIAIS